MSTATAHKITDENAAKAIQTLRDFEIAVNKGTVVDASYSGILYYLATDLDIFPLLAVADQTRIDSALSTLRNFTDAVNKGTVVDGTYAGVLMHLLMNLGHNA